MICVLTVLSVITPVIANDKKNDFNKDGISDILWRTGSINHLWKMQSDGSHSYVNIGSKSSAYRAERIDDFNGDRIADILWKKGNNNYLWYMNINGTHSYKAITSSTYSVAGTDDFNNDGIADILLRKGNKNKIWYMNANGSHLSVNIGTKASSYAIVGTGDLNGDGISDILWRKGHANYIWYMNADGTHTYEKITSKSYNVMAIEDFNNDGIADILWRKDNKNHIWYMNTNGTHTYRNIGTKSNTFALVKSADYNDDGISDILWRKGSSNYLWYKHADGTHTYKKISGKNSSFFVIGIMNAALTPPTVSNLLPVISPLVGTSSHVSFTIILEHKPDSNVTINYSSADETVAKPITNTITFTPNNWYRSQVVTIDIFNPSSSTEIIFDPIVSNDSNYNNKMLEQVSIISHQLLLYEPVDKIVYSEFNMSMPINMAYVGDNEKNITVTLDTAPDGMTLDVDNGRLLGTPALSDEGENKTVSLTVSDTVLTETLSFQLHVAQPTLLATSIVNDKLVITDSNSALNGLSIQALDGAVLADYRLYKLSTSDTPAFRQGELVVGETLLVKGNIGKKVQVLLPLQGLVETDEILSFHTKSYYGSGNWRRVDYDYDFVGSLNEPVYVLNTENLFGVVAFTKVLQSQQAKVSSSGKKLKVNSDVNCVPQTWSFLNLTDYDNQICTFDANSTFRLQIFNYPDATISSNTPIEEVANWVIKAQDKLIELGMPYRPIARGEVPSQYRESSEPLQYIDRIKITCLESSEVFNAVVGSDGTWATTINIVFNGNESRFSIEGYNASDTQRIISRQGLVIVR
jgi:hypothetical protein